MGLIMPQAYSELQVAFGNILWKSGTAFMGTLDHAISAPRNYTFPDIAGTITLTTGAQILSSKSIDADTNTITNIDNADIKAGANIDAAKIGTGVVSTTEYGYLDGVTSAIQSQLNTNVTGVNIGSGQGSVFAQKVGTDLQFKKLRAGTGISLTNYSNNVLINSTALDDSGNVAWSSGTAFLAKLDHSNTADRTYTFPDVAAGTITLTSAPQTLTTKTMDGKSNTFLNLGRQQDFIKTGGTAWYSGMITTGGATTEAMTANVMRASPLIVTKGFAIDRIQFEISTTPGVGFMTVGIYNSTVNGTLYPHKLIISGTAKDTNSAGLKTDTISATLQDNTLYWLVYNTNGTATTREMPAANVANVLGSTGVAGPNKSIGWTVARTYNGTLPTTFPAGGTVMASGANPLIEVRAS